MKIILVPVIIACALGGTVGMLKLIGHIFPDASKIEEKARKWVDEHDTTDNKNEQK